jgi:glycosyltransferase involved in cell wall biosynthesis
VKRVLMIAFHFPPLAFGSGIQRTLRFVQHLPEAGWQPDVLSVNERAYDQVDPRSLAEIPAGARVARAFALDARRDLSLWGRYFGWTANPDRWASWRLDGVRQGCRLIEASPPQVIWSTYPIPTAHLIAAHLHRRTGIPWIADFRDPMWQADYPEDPGLRRSFARIERATVQAARFCVFTSPGALRDYQERYPFAADRFVLIENGYDESSFAPLAGIAPPAAHAGPALLLHSGVVYPSERDPSWLFEAMGRLSRGGWLTPRRLRIRFRASHHDALLLRLARAHGVESCIELAPAIPHGEALREMLQADGLLVMQAANCNSQIPAKLYEYLRARRPILGLTDPAGDTAVTLVKAGVTAIAPLDSAAAIEAALRSFVDGLPAGGGLPDAAAVAAASRAQRTRSLAELLERAATG